MSRDPPSRRQTGLQTHPMGQLEERLKAEPERQDLRLQLLQLYYEAGMAEDYVREAGVYRDLERRRLETEQWNSVVKMGRALEPFSTLFASGKLVLEAWDLLEKAPTSAPRKPRRFGEEPEARAAFQELAQAYRRLRADRAARETLERIPASVAGRFSPLHFAARMTEHAGGARIYVKREDLAPPESYLILHIFGQVQLARLLGCKRIVSGSTSGNRGAVTAAAAAHFGMDALIYLDEDVAERQAASVTRMQLLGARVRRTRLDALRTADIRQAALDDWLAHRADSFLVLELEGGPEPYPAIARDLTGAIGREARQQFLDAAGWLPDVVVARGGGTADAIALFPPFLEEVGVRLVCVEPGRENVRADDDPNPYDPFKQPLDSQLRVRAHSILEAHGFPRVEREHRELRGTGRVEYATGVRPAEAHQALRDFARLEGILPALETSYALAWAAAEAGRMEKERAVLVLFAERGEKDIWDIARALRLRT